MASGSDDLLPHPPQPASLRHSASHPSHLSATPRPSPPSSISSLAHLPADSSHHDNPSSHVQHWSSDSTKSVDTRSEAARSASALAAAIGDLGKGAGDRMGAWVWGLDYRGAAARAQSSLTAAASSAYAAAPSLSVRRRQPSAATEPAVAEGGVGYYDTVAFRAAQAAAVLGFTGLADRWTAREMDGEVPKGVADAHIGDEPRQQKGDDAATASDQLVDQHDENAEDRLFDEENDESGPISHDAADAGETRSRAIEMGRGGLMTPPYSPQMREGSTAMAMAEPISPLLSTFHPDHRAEGTLITDTETDGESTGVRAGGEEEPYAGTSRRRAVTLTPYYPNGSALREAWSMSSASSSDLGPPPAPTPLGGKDKKRIGLGKKLAQALKKKGGGGGKKAAGAGAWS